LGRPHAIARSTVYLARHGQTVSNLERRYAGSDGEPLTAVGRAQAEALADRVAGTGVTEIWSSEIARASETAQIVAARLALPVRRDARLNEMLMGPWEGLTEDEVAALDPEAYQTWLSSPDRVALAGRETLAQLAARVIPVVEEATAGGYAVLLVTHVAPIRVATLAVLRLPLSAYKRVSVRNGDCVRLDLASASAERLEGARSVSLRDELARTGS
jgi:ribonuclease H / adenosylcobalamin/alpha-ribazole phosphatase